MDADHIDDDRFSGSGMLRVSASTPSSYAAWAAVNAGDGRFDEDFDFDGISNGLEYFFGVTEEGFTPSPSISENKITWPRDPAASGVSFVVQVSSTLAEDDWAAIPEGDLDLSDPSSISYTLPEAGEGRPKLFVRLRVTEMGP